MREWKLEGLRWNFRGAVSLLEDCVVDEAGFAYPGGKGEEGAGDCGYDGEKR